MLYAIYRGGGGGGFSHWHGICICACFLRCFCAKFCIVIGVFSSETKWPKFKNLVYFEQIIVKSIRFGQNWGTFLWVGNWVKNWHREIQIFEVWQAHSHMILAKVTPWAILISQVYPCFYTKIRLGTWHCSIEAEVFPFIIFSPSQTPLPHQSSINVGDQTRLLTTWLG